MTVSLTCSTYFRVFHLQHQRKSDDHLQHKRSTASRLPLRLPRNQFEYRSSPRTTDCRNISLWQSLAVLCAVISVVNSVYKIGLFESKPPAASRSTVEANAYPLAPRAYPAHHQSQYSQKGQKGQKGQNMPLSLRGSNPTGIRNYGQRRIRKRISRHFASEGYPTLFSMSSSTLPIEKVI